ncbi:MAG: ComF family protein [Anaerolineae bacterium]|nr:ComF family protein [Anaerolineae bacterium]MDK1080276.1 ComF family protein [Anaerolineae bacterium]
MSEKWKFKYYQGVWAGLDWLFPPDCGGCSMEGTRWCVDCQEKIQELSKPVCDICGLPQFYAGTCVKCLHKPPAFKMLRSWASFAHPIQKALHRLKYRRDIGLGEAISRHMTGFLMKLAWPVEILIPVPLGKRRLKERGYNQVGMIAKPLAMQVELDYKPHSLIRCRDTRTQVGLTAIQRHNNVKGAFKAFTKNIENRTVLLVDDVATTGATLSSAAEALKSYGAREVYAVTIARALPIKMAPKYS